MTALVAPEHGLEAHPWSLKTGWPRYFQDLDLVIARPLVASPKPDEELLSIIAGSLRRIIQQARESVLSEKLNIFDQTAVNMFRDHATKAGQPLLVSLQQGTYQRYLQVWMRFVCFFYRVAQPNFDQDLYGKLRFQILPAQWERYRTCIAVATEMSQSQQSQQSSPHPDQRVGESEDEEQLLLRLDQAVTAWSLSLLCHPLHGNQYASALVAFLALFGIDEVSCCSLRATHCSSPALQSYAFHDAGSFTLSLSAIVKIVQLMVIQGSLGRYEAGESKHPESYLRTFRDKWLL